MIKVMVVDDEYHIREGICQSIPWSELSLQLVAVAENGNLAWELYIKNTPDIILLDINMPGIDGLELAQQIREKSNLTQIIFLTGYNDFPKLKKAISIQAFDYLLKPASFSELITALKKAMNVIQSQLNQHEYIENLEIQVRDYNGLVSDQLLLDIIHQRKPIKEAVNLLIKQGTPFDIKSPLAILVSEIDEIEKYMNRTSQRDRQLYLYAYRKLAQEVLELKVPQCGYVISDNPGKLIVVISFTVKVDKKVMIMNIAKELQEAFMKFLKMSVSIGISNAINHAADLHIAVQEANKAINYRSLAGQGLIIPFSIVEPGTTYVKQMLGKELYLLNELRSGNNNVVMNILTEWILDLIKLPFNEAKLTAAQLIVFVKRLENEVGLEMAIRELDNPFVQLSQFQTMDSMVSFITQYILHVGKIINSSKEAPNMKIIEQAKEWIRNHITEEVSLVNLSKYLHLSPNYLSSLFKQSTGETFSEFTNRVRFERVKELLMNRQLKIQEISEIIGFTDSNYFSIAFKKKFGLTPTEYRQRML